MTFKALQFNPGPPMLLPFLVGKNHRVLRGSVFSPILLASGVSGDFGGPAEARSKLFVDLFFG